MMCSRDGSHYTKCVVRTVPITLLAVMLAACGGKTASVPVQQEENLQISEYVVETDTEISEEAEPTEHVILGDEQFDEYIPLLEEKRVAVFSNQTGIVGNKDEHIVDALMEKDVHLVTIFSPEHGFRGEGDAGESIADSVDEKTGIPIISLSGGAGSNIPSADVMDSFDILVIDIQDVGLRYYTYYVSMYYLMDACAGAGKEVLILDRPNPNGFYVDGPILDMEYQSNVGKLPIPIVHGMTLGELALMINGEGWLTTGKDTCNLKVITCLKYTHETKTELPVNPSPNLKNMRAIYLYASTCFFENTLVSVGRGTDYPFEIYGSPYLEGPDEFSFSFTPVSMPGATKPPYMDTVCYGKDLRDIPLEDIWQRGINLEYLIDAYNAIKRNCPDAPDFWGKPSVGGQYWIDKLSGSADLRKMIEEGMTASEIKETWQDDIEAFIEQRKPYLLYE